MSLKRLQSTIDSSVENASSFSRDLFKNNHLDAEQLQQYVNDDGTMTVATLDREGRPHTAIVAAACVDGDFYIGVTPRTALLGNLRRNPDVAFTVKDKVTGQGRARPLGHAGEQRQLAEKVGPIMRAAIERDWPGYIYAIEPSRVFGVA
jgi:nitroimidazol reductase NimA-like FMN-containing flavoprotein (pyridoxamine 5'-phosphate oxidase superfamily)